MKSKKIPQIPKVVDVILLSDGKLKKILELGEFNYCLSKTK